jgi:hypothetical protein
MTIFSIESVAGPLVEGAHYSIVPRKLQLAGSTYCEEVFLVRKVEGIEGLLIRSL